MPNNFQSLSKDEQKNLQENNPSKEPQTLRFGMSRRRRGGGRGGRGGGRENFGIFGFFIVFFQEFWAKTTPRTSGQPVRSF